MNRGRIIKVVAVALLISMLFPPTVAAEPPPPREPSPLSPMLVPYESFEGWEFPPSGWTVKQKNANQTWRQLGYPLPAHSGVRAAYVLPDANPQKELLLTPKFYAPYVVLSFYHLTGSWATCKPVDGVCDLEVWIVKGAWGGGDDMKLGTVDISWAADNTWYRTTAPLFLESLGFHKPIRIGFRYKGQAGNYVALDEVTIYASPFLNKNYSFEYGGKMMGWKKKSLTAKDKRDNNKFKTGSWSFKMVGSSAKKSLVQTMNYTGHVNDILTVYGCSKPKNAKAGRPYQVVATIFHRDGSREKHVVKFTPGTHPWECKGKGIITKEPYKQIKLEIRYWRQTGKAWFDDVVVAH